MAPGRRGWGQIPGHGQLVGHQDSSKARSWGPANSSAAPGALGSTSLPGPSPCPGCATKLQPPSCHPSSPAPAPKAQGRRSLHRRLGAGGSCVSKAPELGLPSSSLPATAPWPPFPASPRRNPPGLSRFGAGAEQGGMHAVGSQRPAMRCRPMRGAAPPLAPCQLPLNLELS